MGNENLQPTLNRLRIGGVPDVKLLAITARVRWTVVGQPLQFLSALSSEIDHEFINVIVCLKIVIRCLVSSAIERLPD